RDGQRRALRESRAERAAASCAVSAWWWFAGPAKYDLALGCRDFVENPVFDHTAAAAPAAAPL
ncbi:hypothetical protein, partial [Burkholderia vietnamiensis]|uniref:hypothetical protein n=1 Tax=Burkholderia vietnamiensis TaxID=60552 RepID=UPI002656C7DE